MGVGNLCCAPVSAASQKDRLEGVLDPRPYSPVYLNTDGQGERLSRWGERLADSGGSVTPPDPRIELLRTGQVQRLPEEGADTPAMRDAEAEAIAARRGVWAEACCRLLAPHEVADKTGTWRVVRGVLQSVTPRREVTYLNFGKDWRTDFTVIVPARLARAVRVTSWKPGGEVEVRGWIHWQNGPAMTLDVPEQLRVIAPSVPPASPPPPG